MSDDVLARLAQVISQRRTASGESSYTRQLLDGGAPKCARKFGEEATEVIVAALTDSPDALKGEAADALYHLLVLLEARGVAIAEVLTLLEARMGRSGLAEKAARTL